MKLRRRSIGVALALGAAAASIVPIQAAVADSSPPDPYFNFTALSPGTLVTRGAAVDVPVSVTCFPEVGVFFTQVQVTQRASGGRIASGFGDLTSSNCDGFPHTVTVRVIASGGGSAFKVGTALTQTFAFACTPLQCAQFNETKEISIKK
jgi:hypothetical protein